MFTYLQDHEGNAVQQLAATNFSVLAKQASQLPEISQNASINIIPASIEDILSSKCKVLFSLLHS